MASFKRLGMKAGELPMIEKEEPGYPAPPPVEDNSQTPEGSDEIQSFTHHMDSVAYNAKHAAAHHMEVEAHASKLVQLMKKIPGLAKHAKRM